MRRIGFSLALVSLHVLGCSAGDTGDADGPPSFEQSPVGKPPLTWLNAGGTVEAVLDRGYWAAFSIYPNTKMDEQRMAALVKKYGPDRIVINSAADWGVSDPLKVPKTVARMAR